jgi:hypothetical protein
LSVEFRDCASNRAGVETTALLDSKRDLAAKRQPAGIEEERAEFLDLLVKA